MSNYRDDSNNIIVVSDSVVSGTSVFIEDVLRVRDAVFFGIAVTLSSQAIASDEVIDNSIYSVADSVIVADSVFGTKHAYGQHFERVRVSDKLSYGLCAVAEDSVKVADSLLSGTVKVVARESIIASDSVTGQRIVSTLASDTGKVSDNLTRLVGDTVEDTVIAADSTTDNLLAVNVITDSATAYDELIGNSITVITDRVIALDEFIGSRYAVSVVSDAVIVKDRLLFNQQDTPASSATATDSTTGRLRAREVVRDTVTASGSVSDSITQSAVLSDTAIASSAVSDRLYAAMSWHDVVVVQDDALSTDGYRGQTWTANMDSWAMSRYNPYNYNRLVVINEVLYGEADDGIYQLNQEVYPVTASIKTGKVDLGQGALTHPSAAYLEYELIGAASMIVSSTQKGAEQQYTYILPSELASELTNGRFIFGRGLRGRHFAFELIMIGTHGHINDLSIEHMPTSRRV